MQLVWVVGFVPEEELERGGARVGGSEGGPTGDFFSKHPQEEGNWKTMLSRTENQCSLDCTCAVCVCVLSVCLNAILFVSVFVIVCVTLACLLSVV